MEPVRELSPSVPVTVVAPAPCDTCVSRLAVPEVRVAPPAGANCSKPGKFAAGWRYEARACHSARFRLVNVTDNAASPIAPELPPQERVKGLEREARTSGVSRRAALSFNVRSTALCLAGSAPTSVSKARL